MTIEPVKRLGNSLLSVEKPARYTGGEYGIVRKPVDTRFRIALSFPDLYEIGMSNYAMRILYTRLNNLTDISCERVFAPAGDFENLLKDKGELLYSLENGIAVKDFDILAFTVGYELSATGILSVLDSSGIPLIASERSNADPIVIAGGSAITNPAPFSQFLDAVFIGEAEGEWLRLSVQMAEMKKNGADRSSLMEVLHQNPHIWYPGKSVPARRAVWQDFSCSAFKMQYPLPGLTAVQDHGVIEIMRGCPNGCRFCHAGVIYRPHREKEIAYIEQEADWLWQNYGYREITLSSLSTGDYSRLPELVNRLTNKFSSRHISFSLPSLRVNSFNLPILNKISEVRKSGLTFAVETPETQSQLGVNKEVPVGRIIEILREAKEYGWRNAKFYFMQGLPTDTENTSAAIVDYLEEIRKATNIRIHLTVNTFIPKPHTPYERSFQLSEQDALERIYSIKNNLKKGQYKFGFHSPFASILEGVISRGDERVGDIILKAYNQGARLDAWEEHLDRDMWRTILESESWDPISLATRKRSQEEELPWDSVDMGVRKSYTKAEERKSEKGELTSPCEDACSHNCGACNDDTQVHFADGKKQGTESDEFKDPSDSANQRLENKETEEMVYLPFVFSFTKTGPSRFLSHKNLVGVFQRLFTRQKIDLRYTEGFNPKPKMEFANPLSLGVSSLHEVAMIYLPETALPETFIELCNGSMPEGMNINGAEFIQFPKGIKSIMAYYAGSDYSLKVDTETFRIKNVGTKLEELFKDFLGAAIHKDNYISYTFYYPDGLNEIKGISRLIRDNYPDILEAIEIERIKSYFMDKNNDKEKDSILCSLPDSNIHP